MNCIKHLGANVTFTSGSFNVMLTLTPLIAFCSLLINLISIPPFMRVFTFASSPNGGFASGIKRRTLINDIISNNKAVSNLTSLYSLYIYYQMNLVNTI